MKYRRYRFRVGLLLVMWLAGCATPAGKFKEEDSAWSQVTLPIGYQQVYRNVRDGFRRCSHMVIEAQLFTDIESADVDIYLSDILGGRSPWVAGFVKIKALDAASTSLAVGVNKTYDKPLLGKEGGLRAAIGEWASANYVGCASAEAM